VFLDDDDHLVQSGVERFLDDQQDGRFGDAVTVHNREQLFLGCFRRGEQPRAEACRWDESFAHLRAAGERQLQAGHFQVTLDDLDDRLLVGLAAGDELRGAVALRADTLAAPDVGLERLVVQDAMQHGCGELLWTGRDGVAVEEFLRFDHQRAEPLGVGRAQGIDRLVNDTLVDRSQQLLHAALDIVVGERERAVEPGEDFHGVFVRLEVNDHEIQILFDAQLGGV